MTRKTHLSGSNAKVDPNVKAVGRSNPEPAKELRFSTHRIPGPERVELWEYHNAKALIPLDIHTLDEAPLLASEINLYFPSLRLARVKGTAQMVERSESFIRDNPTDVVAIFFALEGDAFFFHRDGHENLKPGQAIMYDADLPFMRGFSQGLQELVLTIPRSDFLELTGGRALHKPMRFDFNRSTTINHHALALAKLVKSTVGNPVFNAVAIERNAVDLVRLLVSGGAADWGTGHLAAAKAYIDQHLRDSDLSAAEVATAIGISDRHLSRIFAEDGSPVGRFIRHRRLHLAKEILTGPDMTTSMGQLAAEVGFSSQNYFTRAFKELFGVSPLQMRQDTASGRLL